MAYSLYFRLGNVFTPKYFEKEFSLTSNKNQTQDNGDSCVWIVDSNMKILRKEGFATFSHLFVLFVHVAFLIALYLVLVLVLFMAYSPYFSATNIYNMNLT